MTTTTNQQLIARPIILTSLLSAPFFDFLAPFIGIPFVGGGCGGMLISPILALIISLFTGFLGWIVIRFIVKKNLNLILIGLLCGLIAGVLAALIYAPMAC